jgi:protocatechuate 3,4-dioxygenase beta subunit
MIGLATAVDPARLRGPEGHALGVALWSRGLHAYDDHVRVAGDTGLTLQETQQSEVEAATYRAIGTMFAQAAEAALAAAEIAARGQRVPGGSLAGKAVPQPRPPEPGELKPTPHEIDGPYFRLGAPMRSNLLEPGDKPELVLSGRVLNQKGVPIPNAVVNLWSSDGAGNYDMLGYKYTGYVVTDEQGRYEFTTIVPGCYFPRDAKHLHVKIQGVSSPVTTQLYIEGEPGNEDDPFYSEELLVHCTTDASGTRRGVFDFVIHQVTERENVTPESLAARV